jgi:two-component system chemotaxis response regulator CheY
MQLVLAGPEVTGSAAMAEMVQRLGFEVLRAADVGEAARQIEERGAQLVILLDRPGEHEAVEGCRTLRERFGAGRLHLVVAAERDDDALLCEAFDAGADDWIRLPCGESELRCRLRTALRLLQQQDEIIRLREQVRSLAHIDGLTGLKTEASILQHLEQEMQRARREKKPIGVIMADIDGFDRIGKEYGSIVSDRLLACVAVRLRRVSRPYDGLGRFSHEDFLLICPGAGKEEIQRIAERLQRRIVDQPIKTGIVTIPVTMSIGAASVLVRSTDDAMRLLRAAEHALARAHEQGGGCIALAERRDYDLLSPC